MQEKTTEEERNKNIWLIPYERLRTNNTHIMKILIPVPLQADF